jgi:methionyl-tRNA formyltransferase
MLRIAFAGTPEFAVPSLRALAQSPHRLVGVLTQPDRPAGRGRALTASPIKQLALELGIVVAQPPSLKAESERQALQDWAPDVLMVVAYGLILPPSVLAIPRFGCINVHASMLPRWRGAAPVQRAILAGDARTGVTIMQMEAGLDTGAILSSRAIELTGEETAAQLLRSLGMLGATLALETLANVEAGTVTPMVQPVEGVTYAAKIDKREAPIDWTQSAEFIGRQVRAFNPWPVAQTVLAGQQLRVWQAVPVAGPTPGAAPGEVLGIMEERLIIQCGQGALALGELQLAGRRVVSAREFASGRPIAGMRLW